MVEDHMSFDLNFYKVPEFTPPDTSSAAAGKGSTSSKIVKKAKTAREQIEDAAQCLMNLTGALAKLENGYDLMQASIAESSIYGLEAILPPLLPKVASLVAVGDLVLATVVGNLEKGLGEGKARAQPFLDQLHAEPPKAAGSASSEPVLIAHGEPGTASPKRETDKGPDEEKSSQSDRSAESKPAEPTLADTDGKDEAGLGRYGCENGKATAGCFLAERARDQYRGDLGVYVGSAMANFHAAIQNVRLDKMLEKDASGWGFLAEFLFYSISGPFIGAAIKGFKAARAVAVVEKAAAQMIKEAGIEAGNLGLIQRALLTVSDENATATLQNLSRGARTALKNERHANHGSKAWDVFLKIVQNSIKPLGDAVYKQGPAGWSDAELVNAVNGYNDPVAHGVDVYEQFMRELLARFHAQALDQINDRYDDGGKTKTVMLEAYGWTTTAVLADHKTGKIRTDMVGEARGEEVRGDGKDYLVSLVDDDLAPYAKKLYKGAVETVHVTEDDQPFTFIADTHLIRTDNAENRFKRWVSIAKAAEAASEATSW